MKLDLHIHSSYSRDASASPAEIARRCKALGLDGLAITDHNDMRGSLEAYAMAASEGIIVVRGVEVSAVEGHVLALGVNELIPRGLSVHETVDRIREAGGVAVAAHPGRFPSGIGLRRAEAMDFDAIEILNGGSSKRSNVRAKAVAESRRMAVTGGSDAHAIEQAGKAWTVVEGASNEDDIIAAISNSRCTVGGRGRTAKEGVRYSWETFVEWVKGDLKRL